MTAQGKKALVLVTDFGVEEAELLRPVEDLKRAGVEVTVASDSGNTVQTVSGDKDWASTYKPDTSLDAVTANDFDIIVLPGGTVNADTLRGNEKVQALLQAVSRAGKPIAAVCHAPWVFIDAALAEGKTLTSYTSVKIDLENAGATWVDEQVKRCPANGWVAITSRNPGDLDAFDQAIVDELAHA
ncbi:type 1 glutamine amidotransferase domain-containing protein [Leekyejoonella antrihumi]|uniref:Type 1 glutamine amidotransferase n=1 Tax=Leekyejoonella antrihumi TaxID=1660198 RepID=A0A563E4Y7_9MICO|nr:type 1 glutamine amidotransferase domain-containing protein [Leekyejoonella antrihumi]TWP37292.1 type 1 glutamine amidotransferase [Leekyejoonella antrihumi]